jgi:hypothetical protein
MSRILTVGSVFFNRSQIPDIVVRNGGAEYTS